MTTGKDTMRYQKILSYSVNPNAPTPPMQLQANSHSPGQCHRIIFSINKTSRRKQFCTNQKGRRGTQGIKHFEKVGKKMKTYTNKHGLTATIEKAKERQEYRATMNGEVYRFATSSHTMQDVKKYLDCRKA